MILFISDKNASRQEFSFWNGGEYRKLVFNQPHYAAFLTLEGESLGNASFAYVVQELAA
jgi:hypothetical protein